MRLLWAGRPRQGVQLEANRSQDRNEGGELHGWLAMLDGMHCSPADAGYQ
jgi:hypothetical protein